MIDVCSVNFKKRGVHNLQAIAVDIHGNQSSQDFSLVIKKVPLIEQTAPIVEEDPVIHKQIEPKQPANEIIPTIKDGILIVNKNTSITCKL